MTIAARAVRWAMPAWPRAGGWTERAGFVVIATVDAARGLGEASPLPGRSGEALAACAAALARAAAARWDPAATPAALAALADEVCAGAPAAAWAVWSAVLDARARARGASLAALLGTPAARLPLAAVVVDVAGARAAVARGVRTLKLKPAPGDVAAQVAAVRAAVGPDVALRVDGNRGLPAAALPALLAGLAPLGVEHVEEPCPDLPLDAPTAPPLALDEALAEPGADARVARALAAGAVGALVLKPTVLGPARTLALAAAARAAGVAAIVSHALEGPVGLAAAAELALALGGPRAAGLGAHPGLDAWPLALPTLGAASLDDVPRAGTGLDVDAALAAARALEPR